MIDTTIEFLKAELDQYLALKEPSPPAGGFVQLTNMFEPELAGSPVVGDNRVGLTVVNIEEEKILRDQVPVRKASNGQLENVNPQIKLNIYALFSASAKSDEYATSLRLISHVITFFQSKYLFTTKNSPGLSSNIERLMLDLYTVPLEQQSYIWGSLESHYLPSVVYKIRVLAIQADQPLSEPNAITQIDTRISNV